MGALAVPLAILLVLFLVIVVLVPVVWFRWQGVREDADHER